MLCLGFRFLCFVFWVLGFMVKGIVFCVLRIGV